MSEKTVIGLDVGYGITKLVNGQTITFPSVAGYARQLKFQDDEISAKYPGDRVTDDDGEWFVGELALSQLNPASLIRLRGRTGEELDGDQFRLRMMKAALGKLFSGNTSGDALHLAVATGLPVDHMPDADRLKESLRGSHLVKTDRANFVAHITDVIVMPQPYGTIYRHLINEQGQLDEYYTIERTGVIDVGTYTTDLTMDDDGEYIDERSGSVEAGVSVIQELVADEYERRYRSKPKLKIIDEIIRTGHARIHGQPESFADVIQAGKQRLYTAINGLIVQRWNRGEDIDAIYVTGGGAMLVYDLIKASYPETILAEAAPTANAEGYLRYARYVGV